MARRGHAAPTLAKLVASAPAACTVAITFPNWPRRRRRWPARVELVHLRLAEIGLRVAARYGFALAGGYAVQAHGILDRPSEDVDLFTAWERRGDFATAVDAVIDGYATVGTPSRSHSDSTPSPGSRSPIRLSRTTRTRSNWPPTGVRYHR
jgi:Nucleotidyl transferase AbiEii toxin, Type IV TA system